MEKGYIKINIEDDLTPSVEMKLVNNTLWLTEGALARFFVVFTQKIRAEIKAIFKNELLYERNCTYYHRYNDKGLEKQIEYYNLDVLIFLAYRLNTFEAQVFRKFIKSTLHKHLQNPNAQETKNFWTHLTIQNFDF
jgi:hypothetical protein